MMESDNPIDLLSDASSKFQEEIQFSRLLTGVCLVVCATGLGLLLWMVTFSDGLRLSVNESRDLERIASRMLGFESRLSELSVFEQMMFRLGGQDGETQEQIRGWYQEIVDEQSDPLDELYLGILYGEAGLADQLIRLIADWNKEKIPLSLFRRLLETGYIQGENPPSDYKDLQARLAEEVPSNWFYYQLAQRVADQSGDRMFQANLEFQLQQLTDRPLRKWRILMIGEMAVIGIGVVFLLRFGVGCLMGRASPQKADLEERSVPWTFREGIAVLARGGALTIVLMGLVAVIPDGPAILENYGIAFLYLPPVILTSVLLCRSRQRSLLQVVGWWRVWHYLKSSMPLIFMVVALGLFGDWLIVIVGDTFQSSVHWTEWFVPQLVWGSEMDLVKTTIEFVVLAPLFEELIFRGVLFTSLRKQFSFPISMVGSSLVFALAHGYGLMAFFTVFWSGCLWAWAYERTGSVIPGTIAHAANNGIVVYSLVAFFR